MQQIPLTLTSLAALFAVLLLVRGRWQSFTPRTRHLILGVALAAMGVFALGYATHWSTASDRLNFGIYWMAIAGYLLLLTVHSLNRPRWLTSTTALVLAVPIFASSIFLPLGGFFHPQPRRITRLANNLYVSWQEFLELGPPPSGVDVDIFYRPPSLPFLRHTRLGGRFYNLRCHAEATEVVLQPDHETVFVRCPSWPGSNEPDNGDYLRLH